MTNTMPLGSLRNMDKNELLAQITTHFGQVTSYALKIRLTGSKTAWYRSAVGTHRVSQHPSGMWFHTLDTTDRD